MKITAKLLSIPPHISTSWNNIIALHVKNEELIISLSDGEIVKIPGLPTDVIHTIFVAHSSYIEQEASQETQRHEQATPPFIQALMAADNHMGQMRVGFSTLDDAGQMMQHNPAQANAPDIPFEILQKIAAIAKIIAPDDSDLLPKAEPHCNCMHCQLSRAMHGETIEYKALEEAVMAAEVPYEPWEVTQTEEKLYLVSNKKDQNEQYNVYLGEPVGCTCGVNGCAHILAVLRS